MRSAKGEAAMLSKAVRQAIARSRRSMVETRRRLPFTKAPCPRTAQ